MKNIFLVLLICAGFAACNTNTDPPTASVNGMFAAMKSGNLDEVKKYISSGDVMTMNIGEQILMRSDSETVKRIKTKITDEFKKQVQDVNYTLKNEKITGDSATVDVEISKDGKTDAHQFNLVKEAGMWKVVLARSGNGMFNSMKGNMGRESRGVKDMLEKLENMPADSISKLLKKGEKVLDSALLKIKEN